MNRHAEIPDKDLTLLSGYIDGALSAKDRAKVEKRLQQSPRLKDALDDLTALKNAMRSLPMKPVPYQFTLTRSEAQNARRGRFLLPAFGWASMVSMILLAVVFSSELIFSQRSGLKMAAEAPAPQMAYSLDTESAEVAPKGEIEEASEAESSPENQQVYPLNWVPSGGMGGGGSEPILIHEAAGMEPESPAESDESMNFEESMPAEGLPDQAEMTSVPKEAEDAVEPLIFGVREDKLGQVIDSKPTDEEMTAVTAVREAPQPEEEPLIPTWVKLTLIGLTAIFGIIWLYLKSRR